MSARPVPDRFKVAFSFAGEQRELVRAIAQSTEARLGSGSVFLDQWFEHYLAGDDADLKLQAIYGERCDLAVVCVSQHYGGKPWTRAEHAAIRARLMQSRASADEREGLAILPIRVGEGEVPGILFNTIVPDVRLLTADQAAELIVDRLGLVVVGLALESTPAPGVPGGSERNPFDGDSAEPIGRESEIELVFHKLRTASRCSLVGPSGSGKSLLLDAIRPRFEQSLGIGPGQWMRIGFRLVRTLRDLQSAIVKGLGGRYAPDILTLVETHRLSLLVLDDLGGMDQGERGRVMRSWLRGLHEQYAVKLLMVSNDRLDRLFSKDDPNRDSPFRDVDPLPVELAPLAPADCARLVALRLAGRGYPANDYADLCREPRYPRDLLHQCAVRFERLRSGLGGSVR